MNTEAYIKYEAMKADSTKIWLLFLFLGWSYGSLGKMTKQIFFYLTLGGVGMWTIYRLFTLNKAIRKYNRGIAKKVGLDANEQMELGLL